MFDKCIVVVCAYTTPKFSASIMCFQCILWCWFYFLIHHCVYIWTYFWTVCSLVNMQKRKWKNAIFIYTLHNLMYNFSLFFCNVPSFYLYSIPFPYKNLIYAKSNIKTWKKTVVFFLLQPTVALSQLFLLLMNSCNPYSNHYIIHKKSSSSWYHDTYYPHS